jgi:hypothetical protein
MIGDITADIKKKNASLYQPSKEVIELTEIVKKDYQQGVDILTKPWVELNDRSVLDDLNRGQQMLNAYVDTSCEDPNEAWKWRGTRSKARNKGIAMHAQLAGGFLLPTYQAQNDKDEIDRDFSEVMRDIVEWMCQPTVSNYQSSFVQIVFGMMSNPVTYLGAEFYEIYQEIKEKQKDGKYTKKEILDEVLSGFQAPIWSASQILITNPYERNIQRQKSIIKRKFVEYDEMKAKYGKHKNWGFVKKGIKSIYCEEDGLFYDIKDDDHPNLVAEEIWEHRRKDLEVPFVNGIYLGDDNVDNNPIKHRDNYNCPKYNIVPFGYMRIGEHFFYYKSMMNALQWDNMAYDAMSEIVFNGAILENEMPLAISGDDKVNSSIIYPNSVTTFEDKDTKVTPLLPSRNAIVGFNVLKETDESMSEGSVNETISGNLPDSSQKAYNVAQAQSAARKLIGSVATSLAESIIQLGCLLKDIVINHYTIGEVEELTGGRMKMKYKTFLLEDKKVGGKMGDRTIKFDEELIGAKMTDKEKSDREMGMLEGSGYPRKVKSLRLVNPEMFAKFKYLSKISAEEMFTKNNEYWQPIMMNLKAAMANDQYSNQEALTRRLYQTYFNSDAEDYMADEKQQIPGVPQMAQQPTQVGSQIVNQMNAKNISKQMSAV